MAADALEMQGAKILTLQDEEAPVFNKKDFN